MKKSFLEARLHDVNDFTNEKELVEFILDALKQQYLAMFETVNGYVVKRNLLFAVDDLWVEARGKACPDNTAAVRKLLAEAQAKHSAYANELKQLRGIKALRCRFKLWRLKWQSIPVVDVVAKFVDEHPDKAEKARKKLLNKLNKSIQTLDMLRREFRAHEVASLRPNVWPEADGAYLKSEQMPYLRELVWAAQLKGISATEIIEAWEDMLLLKNMKREALENWEDLDMSEALHTLFAPLSYHQTKQHYAGFLEIVNSLDD